jgi:hypothetical protein
MNTELRYGGVALGVECAQPALQTARHHGRVVRWIAWLLAAPRRWA